MAVLTSLLNLTGAVLLAHASYEHSLLTSTSTPSTQQTPKSTTDQLSQTSLAATALPIDIVIETLASVLLLCVGVVSASAQLKPIQWNVWAGRLERSSEARKVVAVGEGGGNPYARLEDRLGFLDVRAKGRR